MPVRDVPAGKLIDKVTQELKKFEELKPPEWSFYVKTGVHKERPPNQPDWWYVRAASILRRIYLEGPVGVSRLRTRYGGRKNRGSAPEHFRRGGGKIIRTILQQLESAGFIKRVEKEGRKITRRGVEFLEKISNDVMRETRMGETHGGR